VAHLLFEATPSYTVCTSLECNRSAEEYRKSINFSADPCTDFYEYTCGNWAQQHTPPNHSKLHDWRYIIVEEVNNKIHTFLSLNNTDDEALAVHQARDIFRICMGFGKKEIVFLLDNF
jgi:predicted metalloendopeptidase